MEQRVLQEQLALKAHQVELLVLGLMLSFGRMDKQ
jgi:hypothetical protein